MLPKVPIMKFSNGVRSGLAFVFVCLDGGGELDSAFLSLEGLTFGDWLLLLAEALLASGILAISGEDYQT